MAAPFFEDSHWTVPSLPGLFIRTSPALSQVRLLMLFWNMETIRADLIQVSPLVIMGWLVGVEPTAPW